MAQSLLRGRNVYKQIFRALHVEINGRQSLFVQLNGTPHSRTLSTAVHKIFNFSPMLRLNEFRRSCVSFFSQRKVLSSGTSLNLPSVKQIEQFLASRRIPFEHGHTSIVVGCTSCSVKEKERTELSMYINKTTGSHFCKNCGRSGSWRQFKVMVSEPNSDKTSNTSTEHALSSNPPLTNSSEADDKAIQLWNDSVSLTTTDDHDRIEDQFNIKNLSKESIEKYQVHIAEHKFSEPEGTFKEYKCIVFPWYDSKKSAVHGVKLVRVDRENDTSVSLQPRLGVLGLFGWNTVPSDAKEESEF